MKALAAPRDRLPRDVSVHQRYQDSLRYGPDGSDKVIAEYTALAVKHPSDPLYAYLAARVRIGQSTKALIPDLERVAPSMPPARIALAGIYQSPAFRNLEKARAELEAFMVACPSSLQATSNLRSLPPSDFLARATSTLRRELQRRRDPQSLAYYSTLWSLEFRIRPVAEHEALRRQVALDLRRLRGIDPGRSQAYYSTLQEGYQLLDDREGMRWVIEQERARCPETAFESVYRDWMSANPQPLPTDPPEKRRAYYAAQKQAASEWARQWPDRTVAWYTLVRAIRQLEAVPVGEVEAAGEGLLKAVAASPGQMNFYSPVGGSSFSLLVAYLYATGGVRFGTWPPNGVSDGPAGKQGAR